MKGKGIFARADIFADVQNPVSSTDATKFIPSFSHIPDFSGGSDGKGSACHAGDPGLISGSGRSPGEGNGTHSRVLACTIPWTVEPGGLQSMGSQTQT